MRGDYTRIPYYISSCIDLPPHRSIKTRQFPESVRSRILVVQSFPWNGRQRPHDRGGPQSNTKQSESLRFPAKQYGIFQMAVAKWKKRTFVADLATGPKAPRSTGLSIEEEAIIVGPCTNTRCGPWMIVCTLCSRQSHTCRSPHCIDACSAMASLACPMLTATNAPKRIPNAILSDTPTSTCRVRTAQGKPYLTVATNTSAETSIPRSASGSSTFRQPRGNRKYSQTACRRISGGKR